MDLKKKLLNDSKIYLILDAEVKSYSELFDILQESFSAGIQIFQLRDKHGCARDILKFSVEAMRVLRDGGLFIVNDRMDIALASNASGVHLGQEDLPVEKAREFLGNDFLIGASCQTLEQVIEAQENGADYIGFGSVFKTLTKPDREPMNRELLKAVLKIAKVPLFPIGGIDLQNVHFLKEQKVPRIAVCRAVTLCDNIPDTVKKFNEYLY